MIRPLITGRTISGEALLGREQAHQYYVLQNSRVNTIWILAAIALLLPAVLTALAVVTAALIIGTVPDVLVRAYELGYFIDWVRNLLLLMVAMAFATDVVVSLVALALASNAVTREYQGNTWPLLLLTGLSAREMVLGKWWASVLVLRRDFISVTILRVGLVSLLYLTPPTLLIADWSLTVRLGAYLLAILLTLAFSVLDAQVTAALGVLGALTGRNTGIGLLLRLFALLVSGGVLAWLVLALRGTPALGWLFLTIPAVMVALWVALLGLSLWGALWVGVRARLLPRHGEA